MASIVLNACINTFNIFYLIYKIAIDNPIKLKIGVVPMLPSVTYATLLLTIIINDVTIHISVVHVQAPTNRHLIITY